MKKKALVIVLPIVIIFAIGGFLYWKFITSPEYSLSKIKESIEDRDVTAFEKYVDVDGIIMRLMSQLPEIIGGNKKAAMLGEEINQLILSLVQGPLLKIAKEGVRTVIERGHFDKSITHTDLMSELLKQFPIDTIKIIGLEKIHKQGKVCTIPIQIYVGAYEGETTLELMMRDKGSYWQVAEISNLPKVIYDVAELQKTFDEQLRLDKEGKEAERRARIAESISKGPETLVNDFAQVISPAYTKKIAAVTGELHQKTGVPVFVVTMPDIGGADCNEYANRLYHAWGIGKKGGEKGVLIFVTVKERKMRIETGYGVEGILPDGLVGEILNREMVPYLKGDKFGQGLFAGASAISEIIAKNAGVEMASRRAEVRPKRTEEENRDFGKDDEILARAKAKLGLSRD